LDFLYSHKSCGLGDGLCRGGSERVNQLKGIIWYRHTNLNLVIAVVLMSEKKTANISLEAVFIEMPQENQGVPDKVFPKPIRKR
jgi:hypothetical protein